MTSKRSHEGYLLLDHRGTAGVSDADMVAMGLPAGSGKGLYESATYTCKHCQFTVLIEPKRTRERAYCRGCDHYICDACGVIRARTGACATIDRKVDELMAAAEKQAAEPTSCILLPTD